MHLCEVTEIGLRLLVLLAAVFDRYQVSVMSHKKCIIFRCLPTLVAVSLMRMEMNAVLFFATSLNFYYLFHIFPLCRRLSKLIA